jgi:hypothetical protein
MIGSILSKDLSMRRPARPFVVEVKKKRGNLAKRHSIWGDLDLSAIAAPLDDPAGGPEPTVGRHDVDPVLAIDRVQTVGVQRETPAGENDPSAIADGPHAGQHLAAVETEGLSEEPARPTRKRARRLDEPTLPRGQRWKRRLPRAPRR